MRIVCLLFLFFSPFLFADSIDERLKEAEDYLTVKPSESYRILQQIAHSDKLTEKQQIEWHLLQMRASLPLGKLENLISSVEAIFKYKNTNGFADHVTTVTSALGIWLRRNNYLRDAEISFKCSYENAKNDRLRLILNNSLALLARQANDLPRAKSLFEYSARLAKATKNTNMMAVISNNQGLIALDEGKIKEAEQRFRIALEYYQSINKRAGNVRAGTYLLFTFVIQKELTNYQRLYLPTYQQAEAFPNPALNALLEWVNAYYLFINNNELSEEMRNSLEEQFLQVKDRREKTLIIKHLAAPMGISLDLPPEPNNTARFEAPWFVEVKNCNFNAIAG